MQLSARGVKLTLTGRNPEELETLKERLEGKATVIVADLANEQDRAMLLDHIENSSFDLVINNAAFGLYGNALELELGQMRAMVDVNAKALMEITLCAAKRLCSTKKEGVILNISSAAGELPTPNMSVYGATKSFVTTLSRALDYEFCPFGVRVLVSCPGMVATRFQSKAAQREITLKEGMAMGVDQAVKIILKQLDQKKTVCCFNFRTKCAIMISKFLPSLLIQKLIFNSIKKRI